MPIPITIPRLGWNMEEGTFVEWLKQDGDRIQAGDMLYKLEGEKATEDIECLDDGILSIPPGAPKPGDKIPVGTVIGYLLQANESVPVEPSTPAENGEGKEIHAALPNEGLSVPESIATSSDLPRIAISPRAKRVAKQLGIDWTTLRGTGRTGRIRERDVRAIPASHDTTQVHSAIRKTIAERMVASHLTTAPVTLTSSVDVTHLVQLRNQFKAVGADDQIVPSYTDFLLKLVALALKKHPLLNSSWSEDQIVLHPKIHIGFAVDTDAGLLVPVLRDVDALSVREIAGQSKELVERARAQRLSAADMQGGTFTVTNLGAFGIDAFTPIINLPQCAVLGIGRIQRQPTVIEDEIVVRDRLTLSLTFDHRIVDGAPAARFLQTLSAMIENPGPWLMP